MANRERGEVGVVIGGKTYTLIVDFNALVELQQMYSTGAEVVPVESVMVKARAGELGAMRAIFWASLRRYHPDVTVAAAGELIDVVGGIEALNDMLEKAHAAAAPAPEDLEALGPPNPPKAETRRQGGPGSTSRQGKPASRRTRSGR